MYELKQQIVIQRQSAHKYTNRATFHSIKRPSNINYGSVSVRMNIERNRIVPFEPHSGYLHCFLAHSIASRNREHRTIC